MAESLLRLRTDYIDVLALHEPSAEGVATGRIFEVLWRLVEKGVIRAASVAAAPEIVAAAIATQPRLNFAQLADGLIANATAELKESGAARHRQFLITHGVFSREAATRLQRFRLIAPTEWQILSDKHRIPRNATSSEILLEYAFSNNPDGVVLTSMLSQGHVAANCALAARPAKPGFADDLRRALATSQPERSS